MGCLYPRPDYLDPQSRACPLDPSIHTWDRQYHEWLTANPLLKEEMFLLYEKEPRHFLLDALKITAKEGDLVPLDIDFQDYGRAQNALYDMVMRQWRDSGMVRVTILKARQWGGSTVIAGLLMWLSLIIHRRANVLVVCEKSKKTQGMFRRYKAMYKHMPAWLKPATAYATKGTLEFEGAHPARPNEEVVSRLDTETANSLDLGRGDTYQGVHKSETARWGPLAEEVENGLSEAVPDVPGTMEFNESTAYGWGGPFFDDVILARENGTLLFVPFFWIEQYELQPGDPRWNHPKVDGDFYSWQDAWDREAYDEACTPEETEIVREFHLTPGQLAWRRHRMGTKSRGDPDLFRQEMPHTVESAFIESGSPAYKTASLHWKMKHEVRPPDHRGVLIRAASPAAEVPKTIQDKVAARNLVYEFVPDGYGEVLIWQMPVPGRTYAIGIDPCGGTDNKFLSISEGQMKKRDRAAITVCDANTRDLVAAVHGIIIPREIGELGLALAWFYNEAPANIEMNGEWGSAVLKVFRDNHYAFLYTEKVIRNQRDTDTVRFGWTASRESRGLAYSNARGIIAENKAKIPWDLLLDEMMTMVNVPLRSGDVKPMAKDNCHDDANSAWVVCQILITEWEHRLKIKEPEVEEENRIEERSRGVWDYMDRAIADANDEDHGLRSVRL